MAENKVELKLGYNCDACPMRIGARCGVTRTPCYEPKARNLCAVSQRAYNMAIKNMADYLGSVVVEMPAISDVEIKDIL